MQNFELELEILEKDAKTSFRNWNTDAMIERVRLGIEEKTIPSSQKERGLKLIEVFSQIPSDGSFPGGSCSN